jgi:hypothetical protein
MQQASPERFLHTHNSPQVSGPGQLKFYQDGFENVRSRKYVVLALVVCDCLLVYDMRVNESNISQVLLTSVVDGICLNITWRLHIQGLDLSPKSLVDMWFIFSDTLCM